MLKPVKKPLKVLREAGRSREITKGLKTAAGEPAAHIPKGTQTLTQSWERLWDCTHMQITGTLLNFKVQWEGWCWGSGDEWGGTFLVTSVTRAWVDQGEVMCQQGGVAPLTCYALSCLFLPKYEFPCCFALCPLQMSSFLLHLASFLPLRHNVPSPSYPPSLLVAFPIILQIQANTEGLWADSDWYLCLAPEPSWVLCALFHFVLVYCVSSFCTALNCSLRNSKSLFNDLAELLSELTVNFTEHLFVSLNFVLLWILSLAVHGFIALLDSFNLV